MRRRFLAAAATAALAAFAVPGPPTSAVPLPVGRIVATPGAAIVGYATTEVSMRRGGTVDFVNLDGFAHDVTSRAKGRDGKPLFKARYGTAGTAPVVGVDKLQPGVYAYYCTPHVAMVGTLTVTAT